MSAGSSAIVGFCTGSRGQAAGRRDLVVSLEAPAKQSSSHFDQESKLDCFLPHFVHSRNDHLRVDLLNLARDITSHQNSRSFFLENNYPLELCLENAIKHCIQHCDLDRILLLKTKIQEISAFKKVLSPEQLSDYIKKHAIFLFRKCLMNKGRIEEFFSLVPDWQPSADEYDLLRQQEPIDNDDYDIHLSLVYFHSCLHRIANIITENLRPEKLKLKSDNFSYDFQLPISDDRNQGIHRAQAVYLQYLLTEDKRKLQGKDALRIAIPDHQIEFPISNAFTSESLEIIVHPRIKIDIIMRAIYR